MLMLRKTLLAGLLSLLATPVVAFDVGDPWFPTAVPAPAHRVEFIYGSMRRRMDTEMGPVLVGTPSGGPVGTVASAFPETSTIESNHFLFRYNHRPLPLLATQFDIGYTGESTGGESSIILGGAARVLLLENGPLQLAAQASAHFMPETDTASTGAHPTLGDFTQSGTEKFHQYGVALIGSMAPPPIRGHEIVVYGGPRLMAVRTESTAVVDYENSFLDGITPVGNRAWFSGEQKQKSLVDGVLGLRANLNECWSARVEGRFSEVAAVSASLGANF